MSHELLMPVEMGEADRLCIEGGAEDGFSLMRRAGAAVVAMALRRFPDAAVTHVLCGPGNNGGDGYVVAEMLREAGASVSLWSVHQPRPGSDAARAAAACQVRPLPLAGFSCNARDVVVDALFGAGLSKPVAGAEAAAIDAVAGSGARVIAVDLPSGISGENGAVMGAAVRADVTVTFFRRKPGHLLYPGRAYCGETIVADIGIGADVLRSIRPKTFENKPGLWGEALPVPAFDTHKYARGHACVLSGGPATTGAARLAAHAAARAGAGAVTVLSPPAAMQVNAAHLTAIMVKRIGDGDGLAAFIKERKPSSAVLGPGFGVGERTRAAAAILLDPSDSLRGVVLDADAITTFRGDPEGLYALARAPHAPTLVLTPHEGEFQRLFPDLAGDAGPGKLRAARTAAVRANAIVVYKGPDTVIAAPDGRAAINANGTPWLATAGSGDVLAGIVGGLVAQGMPAFEAACASVWVHAEAGRRFGPGLIAEDLPDMLPAILAGQLGSK